MFENYYPTETKPTLCPHCLGEILDGTLKTCVIKDQHIYHAFCFEREEVMRSMWVEGVSIEQEQK